MHTYKVCICPSLENPGNSSYVRKYYSRFLFFFHFFGLPPYLPDYLPTYLLVAALFFFLFS